MTPYDFVLLTPPHSYGSASLIKWANMSYGPYHVHVLYDLREDPALDTPHMHVAVYRDGTMIAEYTHKPVTPYPSHDALIRACQIINADQARKPGHRIREHGKTTPPGVSTRGANPERHPERLFEVIAIILGMLVVLAVANVLVNL